MNRSLFFFLAPLVAAQPISGAEPTPPIARNVLVIISDDHSASHVGVYGNPDVQTPRLDRLAAEGLRLDRAYVTSPQCAPSRSSLVTGRMPMAIGTSRFSAAVPREIKTTPDYAYAAGIYTGFAGRPYHLDGAQNLPKALEDAQQSMRIVTFPERLDYLKEADNDDDLAFTQFREFLDSVPAGKRFYLQLGFADPHRPFTAPKVHDPAKLTLPPHYPDTPLVRADLAAYYDEVHRLDSNVGRALDLLAERGLADETIVVFMGDNGASQFRGKGALNELGIRVPIIVRWPRRVAPGSATPALFSGEDLAPTLLAALGLPVPSDMTGRNQLALWLGQPDAPRRDYVFAERGAHATSLPKGSTAFDLGRVVVSARHKLIYNALWQLPFAPVDFGGNPMWKDLVARNARKEIPQPIARLYFAPHRPMFELYDLENDPWELINLAGRPDLSALEEQLKVQLSLWMIRDRDQAPLPFDGVPRPRRTSGSRVRG